MEQKKHHVFPDAPRMYGHFLYLHDICVLTTIANRGMYWKFPRFDPWGNGIQFDDHIFSDELKPPPIGPSGPRVQNLVATRMP